MPNVAFKHKEVISYNYLANKIVKNEEIRKWLKEIAEDAMHGVMLDSERIFQSYSFKDKVKVTLSLPWKEKGLYNIIPYEWYINFIVEFESDRDYAFFKLKYRKN